MKSEARTQHLTDAEFSSLLDGAQPGVSAEGHLAVCDYCREELEVVLDSLGSFRSLSTRWAEVEAPRHVPLPARWLERMSAQRTWSAGLAATAFTGALAFWVGFSPHARQAPVPRTRIMAPTNADLAADNSLLLSIDTELSDQAQPVLSAANLRMDVRHNAHRGVGSIAD